MANRVLEIILKAKDLATGTLQASEKSVSSWSRNTSRLIKGVVGTAAALALGKFFKDSIAEARKSEDAMAQLEATVRSTGGAAGFTAQQLKAQADALARLSLFSSEAIQGGLTRLLGYTEIQGDMFERATRASLDMAQVLGIDVSSAAEKVGNALNYPSQALNSLTRQGFRFTEEQKHLIQAFESTGQIAEAQAIILGELELAYGGSAAAAVQTFSGRLDQMGKAWGAVQQAVGEAIISTDATRDGMGKLVTVLADVEQWISQNGEVIGQLTTAFVGLVEGGVKVALFALKGLGMLFQTIKIGIGELMQGIGTLIEGGAGLLRKFGLDVSGELGTKMKRAGEVMADNARVSLGKMLGHIESGEQKATAATAAGAGQRTRLTQEEMERRALAAAAAAKKREALEKEHAKELEKINTELAVRTMMLTEGVTEQQAKEAIRRRQVLGESLEGQVSDLRVGYAQIDRLNLILAAGFHQHLRPAIQQTQGAMMEYVTGPLPRARSETEKLAAALGVSTEEAQQWLTQTEKSSLKLNDAARAAVGLAQGLGLIDSAAASALQNVITLGESMARIAGGDTSGILGVVGALTGLLGGFLGESGPARIARQLMEKHNELLAENSRRLGDLTRLQTPGANIAGVQNVLRRLQGQTAPGSPVLAATYQQLVQELLREGLTVGQFREVLKDLNLEGLLRGGAQPGTALFHSDLAKLLTQFASFEFTTFGSDFASQLDRIGRGVGIGAIAKEAELAEVVGALQGAGATGLLQALAGIDISSAAGREQAVTQLRDLFTHIGDLAPEELGGLTGTQFLDAIARLITLLTDETEDVGGVLVPGVLDRARRPDADWNALVLGMTDVGVDQVSLLASIDSNIGRLVDHFGTWSDATPIGGGVGMLAPGGIIVEIGTITIQTPVGTTTTEDAIRTGVREAVNEALYEDLVRERLRAGVS